MIWLWLTEKLRFCVGFIYCYCTGGGGGVAWCGGAWWLGVVPGLFMYRPDLSGGKGLSVASLGSVYRVSPTSVDYTVELPWFG